jgi:hypothetical protein
MIPIKNSYDLANAQMRLRTLGSPISSSLAAPLQPPSSQAAPREAHSAPAHALCDKAMIANKAPQIIEISISFDFSKLIAFHQDLGR